MSFGIISKEGIFILRVKIGSTAIRKLQINPSLVKSHWQLRDTENTYRSIFVNKGAEDWVSEKCLVSRQLQKTFLLTTQELPIKFKNIF